MTTIRSGAPVLPPTVTSAAPATAASSPATSSGAAAPQDTFTPASGAGSGAQSGQAVEQKGIDALTKIGTDDANKLAALLKKPNLTNDDVTQMQQLAQNLSGSGISDADKAAISDASGSKMIDKGIMDSIFDAIRSQMQKSKLSFSDD